MHPFTRLILACTLGILMVSFIACTPDRSRSVEDAATLCSGPGENYGFQDFPCPDTTVEGWVSRREGERTRQHAWYLFAGLNRPQDGAPPVWRTWPTSSNTFPGQYGSTSYAGLARSMAGARLEYPAPGTPRYVGLEKQTLLESDPGIKDKTLSLPGTPRYSVPDPVKQEYSQCFLNDKLIDGPTLQSNDDVMIAGVIYSPNASEWILEQKLWDASYLDSLLPMDSTAAPVEKTMPENSVVLKPMLWPVRGDGYTPLPLWDNLLPDADQVDGCEVYSGFERKDSTRNLWSRAVALTAMVGPSEQTIDSVSYLGSDYVHLAQPPYNPQNQCAPKSYEKQTNTYYDVPFVSLDRFYQFRYSQEDLDRMAPCDRALLDQSAYWSFGRKYEATDALVLIALHMMTKEQPHWTFQSAWWFDGAWDRSCSSGDTRSNDQCKRFSKSRPTDVAGPTTWQNYLMTSTYGMTQIKSNDNKWPPGLDSNNTYWPLAYNPYIEPAATHPIETNCRNCHLRAAWPPTPLNPTKEKRFPERNAAYLKDGKAGEDLPGLLHKYDYTNPIFNGLVTLDAMWAISDRAYYPDSTGQ